MLWDRTDIPGHLANPAVSLTDSELLVAVQWLDSVASRHGRSCSFLREISKKIDFDIKVLSSTLPLCTWYTQVCFMLFCKCRSHISCRCHGDFWQPQSQQARPELGWCKHCENKFVCNEIKPALRLLSLASFPMEVRFKPSGCVFSDLGKFNKSPPHWWQVLLVQSWRRGYSLTLLAVREYAQEEVVYLQSELTASQTPKPINHKRQVHRKPIVFV